MSKADHRDLSGAYRRYDRLTAYGCAQRDEPFDSARMMTAYRQYRSLLHSVFPDQWERLA